MTNASNPANNNPTISKQQVMARALFNPWFSSHLHTGCMTMATSNPKNKGIKSVLPKYRITAVNKITCR
jgi:hypothetical protein